MRPEVTLSMLGLTAAVFNTRVSRKAGLKFDREAAFKHAYGIGSNATVDPRLLSALIDRSHEVYDWSETQSWGGSKAMNLGFIPDQGVARMIVKGSMPQGPFLSLIHISEPTRRTPIS